MNSNLQYNVIVTVPPHMCMEYTYITRGHVERLIQHEVKPSVVLSMRHFLVLDYSYTPVQVMI